jgi:hypothetical protein
MWGYPEMFTPVPGGYGTDEPGADGRQLPLFRPGAVVPEAT